MEKASIVIAKNKLFLTTSTTASTMATLFGGETNMNYSTSSNINMEPKLMSLTNIASCDCSGRSKRC